MSNFLARSWQIILVGFLLLSLTSCYDPPPRDDTPAYCDTHPCQNLVVQFVSGSQSYVYATVRNAGNVTAYNITLTATFATVGALPTNTPVIIPSLGSGEAVTYGLAANTIDWPYWLAPTDLTLGVANYGDDANYGNNTQICGWSTSAGNWSCSYISSSKLAATLLLHTSDSSKTTHDATTSGLGSHVGDYYGYVRGTDNSKAFFVLNMSNNGSGKVSLTALSGLKIRACDRTVDVNPFVGDADVRANGNTFTTEEFRTNNAANVKLYGTLSDDSRTIALSLEINPDDCDRLTITTTAQRRIVPMDVVVVPATSPASVVRGTDASYKVIVKNSGYVTAQSSALNVTIPASLHLKNPTGTPCNAQGTTNVCSINIPRIDPKGTVSIDLTFDTIDATEPFVDISYQVIPENDLSLDIDSSNNTASVRTQIIPAADLAVTSVEALTPPVLARLNQPVDVRVRTSFTQHGPTTPVDASLSLSSPASPGIRVTIAAPTTSSPALALNEVRTVETQVTLTCLQSGLQTVTFVGTAAPQNAGYVDPVSTNNQASTSFVVNCTTRVINGLAALYTFKEGNGDIVRDVSGVTPALNLTLHDTTAALWSPGGLVLTQTTLLASDGAATRLTTAISTSKEMTLEAWIVPAPSGQNSLARILTLADDDSLRNVALQAESEDGRGRYTVRLRTSETTLNGRPALSTASNVVSPTLQHVVYTRDALGTARIYVDGIMKASETTKGDLSNWDASYHLVLGNTLLGDRPWLGEYQLVALYSYALSPAEIQQNFQAGSSGTTTPSTFPELESLYTFRNDSGATVHDQASKDEFTDLVVSDTTTIRWTSDGLAVDAPTIIASSSAATNIISGTIASGEVTLEAWVTPAASQSDSGRIVTLSNDDSRRNLELFVECDEKALRARYTVRQRTSATRSSGRVIARTPWQPNPPLQLHIVYTRDALGIVRLYVNGVIQTQRTLQGDLRTWDANYHLVLGNTLLGDRPWTGTYHRVALYSRALSPAEVITRFANGL